MKVYIVTAILLLARFAFAEEVIDINDDLDQALVATNKILTTKGKGLITLRPLVYENMQLLNGVLVGANSLVRTGNATLSGSREDESFRMELRLGQRLYELAFGTIKLNGEEMSGSFRVRNSSFHVDMSLSHYNRTDCLFRLHQFQYERLTDVTFEASLPGYGGDVSETFTNTVLPRINERVAAQKDKVEQTAKTQLCEKPPLKIKEFLVKVLSILFNF